MQEINDATSLVYESADPDANIIFGVVIDERMKDEMRVTIIATGFSESQEGAAGQPGGRMQAPPLRQRENIFAGGSTTATPTAATHEPNREGEPNPIPAIDRKREREQTASTPTRVNFERDDNPLRDWDQPQAATAPATPASSGPAASVEPQRPGMVFHEPPVASHAEAGNPDEDPYDIPALQRRRKQRFFE
jgi:hypothetical protein